MWPFKTKSVEHSLQDLVDALVVAFKDQLVSVLVFGSKASGEFRESLSDVNVMIILESISEETLTGLKAPLRTWNQADHAMPVILSRAEFPVMAKNLPIEFLDLQDHHKVLHGADLLQGLAIDKSSLRAQCAEELSVKLLKLRQGLALVLDDPKGLRRLLVASLPSVLTLFRAALRLESEPPKGHKIVAAVEMARRCGFDGDVLERLWGLHMRRQTDNLRDLAGKYLDGIERVLARVSSS